MWPLIGLKLENIMAFILKEYFLTICFLFCFGPWRIFSQSLTIIWDKKKKKFSVKSFNFLLLFTLNVTFFSPCLSALWLWEPWVPISAQWLQQHQHFSPFVHGKRWFPLAAAVRCAADAVVGQSLARRQLAAAWDPTDGLIGTEAERKGRPGSPGNTTRRKLSHTIF